MKNIPESTLGNIEIVSQADQAELVLKNFLHRMESGTKSEDLVRELVEQELNFVQQLIELYDFALKNHCDDFLQKAVEMKLAKSKLTDAEALRLYNFARELEVKQAVVDRFKESELSTEELFEFYTGKGPQGRIIVELSNIDISLRFRDRTDYELFYEKALGHKSASDTGGCAINGREGNQILETFYSNLMIFSEGQYDMPRYEVDRTEEENWDMQFSIYRRHERMHQIVHSLVASICYESSQDNRSLEHLYGEQDESKKKELLESSLVHTRNFYDYQIADEIVCMFCEEDDNARRKEWIVNIICDPESNYNFFQRADVVKNCKNWADSVLGQDSSEIIGKVFNRDLRTLVDRDIDLLFHFEQRGIPRRIIALIFSRYPLGMWDKIAQGLDRYLNEVKTS